MSAAERHWDLLQGVRRAARSAHNTLSSEARAAPRSARGQSDRNAWPPPRRPGKG